jgi:hypothetical protein
MHAFPMEDMQAVPPEDLLYLYSWNFTAPAEGGGNIVPTGAPNPTCDAAGSPPNFGWRIAPGLCTRVISTVSYNGTSNYLMVNSSDGTYGAGSIVSLKWCVCLFTTRPLSWLALSLHDTSSVVAGFISSRHVLCRGWLYLFTTHPLS